MINPIMKKIVADKEKRLQKVFDLIDNGVEIEDPEQLYIRGNLVCGKNVKFDVNVIIEGDVELGDDVVIGANTILKSCRIGNGSTINPFSLVEYASVGEHCFVGPYGRIRSEVAISDYVQIGNFVEIKNANIASRCRINHLAFVGDADLADSVTIGAGTITCNHDGVGFNRTTIAEGVYVGSGCNLVAPLKINKNATIAAGSTITEDVDRETLAVARSRQVPIDSWKGPKSRR